MIYLRRRSLLVAVFTLSTLLASCETMQSTSSNSSGPIDARLNQNKASFLNKSTLQACGVGAAAGALGCLAAGKGADCAIIAAVAGCGVGAGANKYLEYQKNKYASQEERINASIADVQKDNNELRSMNQSAKLVINDNLRQLKQIKRDIASKKVDQVTVQRQLAQIDRNTAELRKRQDIARERLKGYQAYASSEKSSGGNTKKLDQSIASMQREISSLEKELDQLTAQRSALKLG